MRLYINSVSTAPIVAVRVAPMTDDSRAYNLNIGEYEVPCISEKHAQAAFLAVSEAIKNATNCNTDIY